MASSDVIGGTLPTAAPATSQIDEREPPGSSERSGDFPARSAGIYYCEQTEKTCYTSVPVPSGGFFCTLSRLTVARRPAWFFAGRGGGSIAERGGPGGLRVNERIRAREVRLIDEEGNQFGVVSLFDALKRARDSGLDLVEISPNANPPVCKLVDYGKFLYEQNKKAHEQKKHQKGGTIKEVKFRPSTAEHDYQVRKNQIIRFLGEGYKVKAMIFHRGREMAHQDVGRSKMERLLKDITDHAQVEFGPRMEANILLALLAPKKGVPAPAGRTQSSASA